MEAAMNFDMHFRIKQLRTHFKISANKLSQELGISQPALSKIENGKSFPSWSLLEKICNYFNIVFSEFFDVSFIPEEISVSNCEKIRLNSLEMNLLGKKIKYLRESNHIQRNDFEKMFNVSQSQLSRIENGKNPPQFELLENICSFFKISISSFFSLNIDEFNTISSNNKIISLEQALVDEYGINLSEIKTILKIRKFSSVEKTLLSTILDQYEDELSKENSFNSDNRDFSHDKQKQNA